MAYTSGTANGYLDLLAKVRDFVTQHGWQVIAGVSAGTPVSGDYISFKGTGLTGTDEIFVSISASGNVSAGRYNWRLYGHVAYNPAMPGVTQQGNFSGQCAMLLTANTIAYWIICNGRCFKVITRINGRYDACYLGFFLPDHTPNNYAYPLFVGGSALQDGLTAADDSWSHLNFWQGAQYSGNANYWLVNPMGAWRAACGYTNNNGGAQQYGDQLLPWAPNYYITAVRRQIDGDPWLQRADLVQVGDGSGVNSGGAPYSYSQDGGIWYGSLDGVFFTPAFGAAVEEIITVGGVGHIVIPNIARTGDRNFAAFALEA